jgi:hypothetical protein
MPVESEHFELPTFLTRDNMLSEMRCDPSTRELIDQEDDIPLSEGENDKNAEMIRKYSSPIVSVCARRV